MPDIRQARYRTISIRATATIAFFLLPLACHTRVNFARSTGSLAMGIHEFSTRVERMNPEPIPVMRPFCVVSPEEFSLHVSPTKLASFFPLVKREILPQFEDESDRGEPADSRETPGDGKGTMVAFLPAELA